MAITKNGMWPTLMTKILSIISAFLEGVGKILDLLTVREHKKAGRNEVENEILKEENKILERQRDNDVANADDAERLWLRWENNANRDSDT